MNLTAGELIRFGVGDSHSMEYTNSNSHIIGYVSECYRAYRLRRGVIKALGGCEIE